MRTRIFIFPSSSAKPIGCLCHNEKQTRVHSRMRKECLHRKQREREQGIYSRFLRFATFFFFSSRRVLAVVFDIRR